jgi:hypothetical protein
MLKKNYQALANKQKEINNRIEKTYDMEFNLHRL